MMKRAVCVASVFVSLFMQAEAYPPVLHHPYEIHQSPYSRYYVQPYDRPYAFRYTQRYHQLYHQYFVQPYSHYYHYQPYFQPNTNEPGVSPRSGYSLEGRKFQPPPFQY